MGYADNIEELRQVIKRLTAQDGCPWDKVQTPLTLADYVIEESHELVSAIRAGNLDEIREELGDVLFLLLFIADYYEKQDLFSLADVAEHNRRKMIRRHPHVFGEACFENTGEFLKTWEKIKKSEHEEQGKPTGLYASLPDSLPPLVKAYRIHSKAARAGFTWPDDEEVEQQVESEWLEFLDACQKNDPAEESHELGDILFTLVELGRRKGIKANEALDYATRRFLRRYAKMEELAQAMGKDLASMPLDDQDELWNQAKAAEKD